ncbi:MAG: DUF308 domain-containing protein [Clostridia bacterium]|nr:DUF308 domain-containing protein [Clostridia bacterium]
MDIKSIFERIRRNWIASSIATIIIGLILLLFPAVTLNFISYCLGAVALVMGAIRTVRYFQQDHTYPFLFQSDLVVGLITIGLGIFMMTQPKTVISLIPHLFGILVAGCGVGNILRALDAKKAGLSQWGFLLGLAIISVILGVLIMFNPFGALELVVTIIGGGLVYEGATDLFTTLLLGKRIDAWKKSIQSHE